MELLAQRGADVAVAYRTREAQAAEAGCAVRRAGRRSFVGRCDVADRQQVEQFFADVARDLGTVDVLVNNAGVTADAHMILLDPERWDQVLATNLDGAYNCIRAAVRGMLQRRPRPHRQHHVAERRDAAGRARRTTRRRRPGSLG